METQKSSAGKIIPIFMAAIGIALAAAAVFATRTSYDLRFELKQANEEVDSLKKQLATKSDSTATETAPAETDTSAKDTEIAKLRGEIDKLKQSTQQAALMPRVAQPTTSTNTNRGAWMEQLREQDPERYKQMVDAREQRRKQAETFFKDQQTRLDERLQSAQTKDEGDLIGQISDTLTKMNDLRGQWDKVNQLPEDQRREQAQQLGQESWQTYQTYSQLREKDRQMQLQQLASQIGYSKPQDAAQFQSAVNAIIKETDTSMNRMMGGMGFGRGGRGGGPGGTPQQ